MNINLIELLSVFDELLPLTDEEQKVYWIKYTRLDEISITVVISSYEDKAGVYVEYSGSASTDLHLDKCKEIRVLDEKRKCLEILHDTGRCFLALQSKTIIEHSSF